MYIKNYEHKNKVYCAIREKKIILRVWSLAREQSEGNNHTSEINVFLSAVHRKLALSVLFCVRKADFPALVR